VEDRKTLAGLGRWRRLADYLTAASGLLKDNLLLAEPLRPEHLKDAPSGSFSDAPALNAVYAHLSRFARDHQRSVVLVQGLGHPSDAVPANLWIEGTLGEFEPRYQRDHSGLTHLLSGFSWPSAFTAAPVGDRSDLALFYGMCAAREAAPALVVCLVSDRAEQRLPEPDGDAWSQEAPWLVNDLLDGPADARVLPIVAGRGDFERSGYEVLAVAAGMRFEARFLAALEAAVRGLDEAGPRWPLIRLEFPPSLGMPDALKTDAPAVALIESWLRSYRVKDLLDADGGPHQTIRALCPPASLRLGATLLETARRLRGR